MPIVVGTFPPVGLWPPTPQQIAKRLQGVRQNMAQIAAQVGQPGGLEALTNLSQELTPILDAYTQVWRLAFTDALTGLANGLGARQALQEFFNPGRLVSAIALDIDHFKSLQDAYGTHRFGDEVIRTVAERVAQVMRPYDAIVARLHGDEFAVFAAGSLRETALQAEEIRRSLAARPLTVQRQVLPITASLGVASVDGCAWEDLDRVTEAADVACYASKRRGRNRVSVAL